MNTAWIQLGRRIPVVFRKDVLRVSMEIFLRPISGLNIYRFTALPDSWENCGGKFLVAAEKQTSAPLVLLLQLLLSRCTHRLTRTFTVLPASSFV